MSRLSLLVMGLAMALASPNGVLGADPVPDPSLTPEQVMEIQLEALRRNDEPEKDAGIGQTWVFAHPNNKRITGPLERFAAMIKGPAYRMLVDHRAHTVEPVAINEETAMFAVTVVPASGPVVFYTWRLEKVRIGSLAGSWMTIAVSAPLRRGDSI